MAIEIAPQDIKPPEGRSARRELRALWRLGAWGGGAAIALGLLAIVAQTERGSARLQLAFASDGPPVLAAAATDVPPRVIGINPDSLRLEAQLRVLAADRDRLAVRLASVERNLDDMTGSIKKQAALATDAPKIPAPPIIAPLAMPASADTAASWPASGPAQTAATAALAQEPVPLPPTRVAAAPANEPAAEPPRKPELGVDLGGASSLDVLNARWMAVKANFGPLLTGLHPRAGHNNLPGNTDYRLLVGPVPNAAAAAHLCARFAAARVNCRTAKFDGERIAQR